MKIRVIIFISIYLFQVLESCEDSTGNNLESDGDVVIHINNSDFNTVS